MKQRLLIIGFLCIVLTLVFGVLHVIKSRTQPVVQTATTTEVVHCDNDAKLCPDGTSVLRTGPRCEFAACPSVYGDVSQWRTRKDETNGVGFKYPETFGTQYITGNQWPPKFTVSKDSYMCDTTATTTVSEHTHNGHSYCMYEQTGAAAGSTYTKYEIAFAKDDKTVTMSFVLQKASCLNYQGTEQSACQATQASFKVLELVDAMAETVGL
jgi:hypothetical protein